MTRRRPFSYPGATGRLVGTLEEIAEDLGVPAEEVVRAVAEARLAEWGANARQQRVWSVAAVRGRALGLPEPPRPRRGDRRFGIRVGRGRSRQEAIGGHDEEV